MGRFVNANLVRIRVDPSQGSLRRIISEIEVTQLIVGEFKNEILDVEEYGPMEIQFLSRVQPLFSFSTVVVFLARLFKPGATPWQIFCTFARCSCPSSQAFLFQYVVMLSWIESSPLDGCAY